MTMDLDTGAVVSVIGDQTYLCTWPHNPPPLQPSTVELHTYSGEELKVLGSITVTVDYQGQLEELSLLVVKVVVPAYWIGTGSRKSGWTGREYASCNRYLISRKPRRNNMIMCLMMD